MSITLVPIHQNGSHQRSLQVVSINDAYTEVRRHARMLETNKVPSNLMFMSSRYNPVVKFAIIDGDKVEVVEVKDFNRLTKI